MKKIFKLLGIAMLSTSFIFTVASCKKEEVYKLPEPTYNMGGDIDVAADVLVNFASGDFAKGIQKLATTFISKGMNALAKDLGYKKMSDSQYRKDSMKALKDANNQLFELNNKADYLMSAASDSNHRQAFDRFQSLYKELQPLISTPFQVYNNLDTAIEEGYEVDAMKTLESIFASVYGTEENKLVANLEPSINKMASYLAGDGSKMSESCNYSILRIAEICAKEKYANKDSIRVEFQETVDEPLALFYNASFLLNLNYSLIFSLLGMSEIYLAEDGMIYAFRLMNDNTLYLHSSKAEKNNLVAKYNPEFKKLKGFENDTLANYECKPIQSLQQRDLPDDIETSIKVTPAMGDAAAISMERTIKNLNLVKKEYKAIVDTYSHTEDKDKVYIQNGTHELALTKKSEVVNVNSIISDGDKDNPVCDPNTFGNISKADFEALAKRMLESSKEINNGKLTYLTFRQFFTKAGIVFQDDSSDVKHLLLGVTKGFKEPINAYSNYTPSGICIALIGVDLDMSIKDFVASPKYFTIYYNKELYSSGCNNMETVVETTKTFFLSSDLDGPISEKSFNSFTKPTHRFLTIFGLSYQPLTKATPAMDMKF